MARMVTRLSTNFKAGYKEGQKLYVSLPLLRFYLGVSRGDVQIKQYVYSSELHAFLRMMCCDLVRAFEECMMDSIQSTPSFELLLLHPLSAPKQALHSC